MNSKTFCIIPWAHTRIGTTGEVTPCCKISKSFPTANIESLADFDTWWNGTSIKNLRRDLANGHRTSHCAVCWTDEAAGKNSLRQEYNKRLSKYTDLDAITNNDSYHNNRLPIAMELDMGNVCNFKCVMCSPSYSSKIQAERHQHKDTFASLTFLKPNNKYNFEWPNQEPFQSLFASLAPQIKLLQLKGGEPLMIDNVLKIIKSIQDPQHTLLYITSNGSVNFDDEFLQYLQQFKSCAIQISVDGIGEHGEYIRYGSSWATTQRTIDRVRNLPNCVFRINTVFQVFSAVTFEPIAEYALNNNFDVELLMCYSPKFLGINSMLPQHHVHLMQYLDQKIQKHPNVQWLSVARGLCQTYKYDPILHAQCRDYITILNSVRNNTNKDILKLFHNAECANPDI